ncbi:ABC transporter permease [Candidatus Saccharibacteria bacterium]|nr:ABC transporter permease [Candidatus Saccharibacteria bacterium]
MIFWTLLFPIALATFFQLAFSGMMDATRFDPISVAVVEVGGADEMFAETIRALSAGDNRIFELMDVKDEAAAVELLQEGEIVGFFLVGEVIEVVVRHSGISATIMQNVVDSYYQTGSVVAGILEFNPGALNMELVAGIHTGESVFQDVGDSEDADFTLIMFYALIGMVCLFAAFFGLSVVTETEANLSKKAARMSVSGTHKMVGLVVGLISSFVVAYAEMLILLAFMVFVLGVSFGSQVGWILVLSAVGILAGIAMGMVIGAATKWSDNAKYALVSNMSVVSAFLAGMMLWQMRYVIEAHAPIVNRINPATLITDALYSLYFFDSMDRYFANLMNLILITGVFVLIAYVFVRRKRYDSV